ncbi:MAG: PrgI family protein [Candidatus Pacebacteria bacterium]|nr:PrgI family protein [Candidatus Paceibacterota bacterium]
MQYKVPQFIDHEAKIVGPLTFKQLSVVGVGGFICLVLFFKLEGQFFTWIMSSAVVMSIFLSLTFIQVEGMPLITVIGKSIGFFTQPKRYIWHKKNSGTFVVKQKVEVEDFNSIKEKPKTFRKSKIQELWSDIEIK